MGWLSWVIQVGPVTQDPNADLGAESQRLGDAVLLAVQSEEGATR